MDSNSLKLVGSLLYSLSICMNKVVACCLVQTAPDFDFFPVSCTERIVNKTMNLIQQPTGGKPPHCLDNIAGTEAILGLLIKHH